MGRGSQTSPQKSVTVMRLETWKGGLTVCVWGRWEEQFLLHPWAEGQLWAELWNQTVICGVFALTLTPLPTGNQGHSGPSLASPATCLAALHIYPPPSSPILSRPTCSATGGVREKITTTNEGLATFLWVSAVFNHRPLREGIFE